MDGDSGNGDAGNDDEDDDAYAGDDGNDDDGNSSCIVSDYAWAGLQRAKGSEIIVSDEWKICLCSHELQSTEKGDWAQSIQPGVRHGICQKFYTVGFSG